MIGRVFGEQVRTAVLYRSLSDKRGRRSGGPRIVANLFNADILAENITAELWLNDIPLGLVGGRIPYVATAAAMYVVEGENLLEAVISPGPEPSQSRAQHKNPLAANASAHARLTELEMGQFTDDPNAPTLIRVDWKSDGATQAPVVIRAKAKLSPMLGAQAWQSAPILKLDASMVGRVTGVLEQIRTSLAKGDAAVLGKLAQPKFEAAARAFPARSLVETMQQFVAVVERYGKTPGWSMKALDSTSFSFRLVAGGRLVECIDKDWKATVRSIPPEGRVPIYFPMFMGMVRGSLAIFL